MRCWLRTTSWKPSVVSSFASPMQTIVPPGRSSSSPSARVASRADRVEHEVGLAGVAAPRASRRRRARRATSARARRSSCGSTTATCGMPSSSAAWSVTSPIVPAPMHDGALDAVGGASRTAWTPLASGSISAPTRDETPSGSTPRVGGADPHEVRERARDVHADQHAVAAEVRVPGAAQPALAAAAQGVDRHPRALELRRRPRPVATTVPANSWPMTSGGVRLPMWPR